MAQLFAQPFYTAIDANGNPISGATLDFYATGTTTRQSTYTTAALSVAHANPVVADSAGRFAAIYLDPDLSYRADLKDAGGALIKSVDPLTSELLEELAGSGGSARVGYNRGFTGAVTHTLEELEDARSVSVFESMSSAQQAAVIAKSAIAGEAEAINVGLSATGSAGLAAVLPDGLYDLRAAVTIPPAGSLIGAGPSYAATTTDPGFTHTAGAVLTKKHTGNAITVTGGGAYAVSGLIYGFAISSDRTTYAGGNGLVVDSVGSLRVGEIRALGIGGDSFVFGTSAGDITGQIHAWGLYSNNPTGKSIKSRSKWFKGMQIETDGGTHSYYADACSNGSIAQFHFEGASSIAVEFANASKAHVLRDGFVALTNVAATHAFVLADASGNTDLVFDTIHSVGHSTAIGALVQTAAFWSRWVGNIFDSFQYGIVDTARGTQLDGCRFYTCATPIRTAGNQIRFDNLVFEATSGTYAIEFTAVGSGGHIAGCVTDKPFKQPVIAITWSAPVAAATSANLASAWTHPTGPYTITFSDGSTRLATLFNGATAVSWTGAVTATSAATVIGTFGYFGTTNVSGNSGYKTAAGGITSGAVATGVVIPHGMSVTPWQVDVWSSAALPADFAFTWDGTNITATWGGGLSFTLQWEAKAYCETV